MSMPRVYTIALVQMGCTANQDDNLARAMVQIRAAGQRGAQVICLQELFLSLYFCQREDTNAFDLAEPIPGPTTETLCQAARETNSVIIAPIFERRAPGLYHNSAAVIDGDGKLLGVYRKMHIPDDPGYYEKFYFAPGDLGFRIFDTQAGRIAVMICWDQWFPEGARLAALKGADILFYPTAIGWHPSEKAAQGEAQRDAWRTVQRGHAVANGIYVAAVNRIGLERPSEKEDGIEFWGSSFVADPQGVLLAEAPTDRETLLVAQVDLDSLEKVRRNWPFLRDRRIDAYSGIIERYLDEEDR